MAVRRRRRRRLQLYWNTPSKRVIRDRLNSLEAYTDDELFERYRFRQVVYLLNLIGGTLLESTRNNALPPMLQLFVCLRFFATGAYHKLIGDSLNVSESTAGRCCRSITEAILHVRKQFIVFPRDDEARKTKQEFIKIAGMLSVVLFCFLLSLLKKDNSCFDFCKEKNWGSCSSNFIFQKMKLKVVTWDFVILNYILWMRFLRRPTNFSLGKFLRLLFCF